MKNKKSPKPWEKLKRKAFPKRYVEDRLIELEKISEAERNFWRDFQFFLSQEREKRINEIFDALASNCVSDVSFKVGRIVEAKFRNDPLNSDGSII